MNNMKLSAAFDLIPLILASILTGWLLLPRPIAAHAQQLSTPNVEVLSSQQIDMARRIGNVESRQEDQGKAISALQVSITSESTTTRTAGGILMAIIVILLSFNALKKFK